MVQWSISWLVMSSSQQPPATHPFGELLAGFMAVNFWRPVAPMKGPVAWTRETAGSPWGKKKWGDVRMGKPWENYGKMGKHRKIMGKLRINMGKIGELRYLNRNIRWKHWTFTGSHEKNHGKSLGTGKRMGYWTQGCELLWMSVSYCYEMVHG